MFEFSTQKLASEWVFLHWLKPSAILPTLPLLGWETDDTMRVMLGMGLLLFAVLLGSAVVLAVDCAPADTACWNGKAREIDRKRDQEKAAEVWKESVTRCTSWVKANVDAEFDAFVPSPGRVETIAPSRARFEFKKCMAKNGQAAR